MPLDTEKLRGKPLPRKPTDLSRCGMSVARYAQHRDTQQWYELTSTGQIIGSPLQVDFYTRANTSGAQERSQPTEKQLART